MYLQRIMNAPRDLIGKNVDYSQCTYFTAHNYVQQNSLIKLGNEVHIKNCNLISYYSNYLPKMMKYDVTIIQGFISEYDSSINLFLMI